jgi:hypothetical protein
VRSPGWVPKVAIQQNGNVRAFTKGHKRATTEFIHLSASIVRSLLVAQDSFQPLAPRCRWQQLLFIISVLEASSLQHYLRFCGQNSTPSSQALHVHPVGYGFNVTGVYFDILHEIGTDTT